jgi:gliding motility-associated-like protein
MIKKKYILALILWVLLPGVLVYAAPCNFAVTISKTDVDCYGNATGSATASVTGTSGPYAFLWSTGDTTATINNLSAQTYFVKVTDLNGCEIIEFVQITQPDKITIDYELNPVLCNGENTGSIEILATGGFGTLTYLWSNGNEIADNLNLYQGEYSLTITDANFCERIDTFIIEQPDALTETHVVQNVLGYGLSDGAIDISVDGGIMPYAYQWFNNGTLVSTLEDIYQLTAGDYTASITDVNNCVLQTTIAVIQPSKIESWYTVTDVNCKNGTDGAIDLTVVGGVPPYTYVWANSEIILNETTQDISGLKKDYYWVTVSDFNGIKHTDSIFVDEPSTIQASLIPTHANCYDSSDGFIALTVSGGVEPYTFLWSDQSTDQSLTDVKANDYSVLIVDQNGCSLIAEATIGQPDLIVIDETVSHVTCKDQDDGEITLDVYGGIPPYDFIWSNGQTTQNVSDLPGGDYSVTIIDQHNCEMPANYYIQVPEYICIWIPNAFTPNGDGINDSWDIKNSHLYPSITVTVYNAEGFEVFADASGYPTPWDGTFNGNACPSGTYYYIVNPQNGDKPFTGTVTLVR